MKTKTTLIALAMALTSGALARADAPAKSNCPQDCPMNCPHAGMRGAGPMRGGGGWSTGPYARVYDPKTVETLKGEIVQIEQVTPMNGMSEGVHVVLKGDKGAADVHLGPLWYLDHQDTQLAVGDRVEVRGSKVTIAGKPAVIAAEVKKGNETLQLRDAQGLPVWRGWR